MAYISIHCSSTLRGKCVICGKRTCLFLEIKNVDKRTGNIQSGISIKMPVCDGEHYNLLADGMMKDHLIFNARSINKYIDEYEPWVKNRNLLGVI